VTPRTIASSAVALAWPVACGVAWLILTPAVASAEERCRVEISPPGYADWRAAALALEAAMAPGDCAEVRVELTDGRARVTFATRDGRRAERELSDPSELGPAVDALRVTYVVPDRPAARAFGAADDETPPDIRAPNIASLSRWPATPAPEHTSVAVGLKLGFRGGDRLVSPTIELFTLLGVGAWDLGIFLRSEPHYRNTEPNATQPKTQGGSLGVTVGRRKPLGAAALIAGGGIGLAGFHQEGSYVRGEGRLGAYVGVVLPRRARTRLRAGLGAEVSMTHLGSSETDADGTPLVPWLAILLSVAVEYGAP